MHLYFIIGKSEGLSIIIVKELIKKFASLSHFTGKIPCAFLTQGSPIDRKSLHRNSNSNYFCN